MAKRRLRTGPTAALPAKPSQADLLRMIRLADPDAREDGADIVATDVRLHAPVEAEPELVGGALGDAVWACRVTAEGPLPFDYYDRNLAEGLAFRLGGLAVCRGEVTDPADSDRGGAVVILPVRPSTAELETALKALDDSDSDVPAADGDSEEVVAEGDPEVAVDGEVEDPEAADAGAEVDVETEAEADADGAADEEAVEEVVPAAAVAEQDDSSYTVGDVKVVVFSEKSPLPAVQELLPFATDLTAIELRGDDPRKVGEYALRLSDELNGLVVDRWGFRVDSVEDLLAPEV